MFFLVVKNRNHLNIFSPVADALAVRGHSANLVDLNDVLADEQNRSPAVVGWDQLVRTARSGDTIVVGVDWGPPVLVEFLAACRQRNILCVGVVEGCLWNVAGKYKLVDHLLAWGASALTESRCSSVRVVGSPTVENTLHRGVFFEEPPFVLINYKFVHRWNQGRQFWLDGVVAACRELSIDHRISRHPADNQAVEGVAFDGRSLTELLAGASAVVTRPSTVVFEAMAARKPVVVFPILGEPLGEFATPMRSFQIIHSPGKLAPALERALRDKESYGARCRRFFEHHVSFDPDKPATHRIADELLVLSMA